MSDRKYRQRGYQDDGREREPRPKPPVEGRPQGPGGYGPRRMNMPGFREVMRCSRCGDTLTSEVTLDARCPKCATDLHTCAQCTWFDTSRRFECAQPIPERISPKDVRNRCTLFEARVTVERETHSTAPTNARKAFDDLFK